MSLQTTTLIPLFTQGWETNRGAVIKKKLYIFPIHADSLVKIEKGCISCVFTDQPDSPKQYLESSVEQEMMINNIIKKKNSIKIAIV